MRSVSSVARKSVAVARKNSGKLLFGKSTTASGKPSSK